MNNAGGHMVILAGAGLAAAFLSTYMLAAKPSDPSAADETVVVLPQRTAAPAPQLAVRPPSERPAPSVGPGPMSDPAALARTLQRELKRVGCYEGEPNGVWNPASRSAMKAFTERVNASLPVDRPDPVLLALVQAHQGRACAGSCPAGEAHGAEGRCLPVAILGKESKPAPPQRDAEPKVEPSKAVSPPIPVPVPLPVTRKPPVAAPPGEPPPRVAVAPPAPTPLPAPTPVPVPAAPRADALPEPDADPPPRRLRHAGPAMRVYGRTVRRFTRRAQSMPSAYARSLMRSLARVAQPPW